jgi:hypothetical protein
MAGDRFFFDVQANVGASNARWRLFDPYGKSVFNSGFTDVNAQTVANTGSYTLVVEGSRFDSGNPTYAFNVQFINNIPPSAPTGAPLILGSTTNGTITNPGEQDNFVFSLTERKLLYLDSLTNSGLLRWKLVGPSGELANRSFNSSDQFQPLLDAVPGEYTLTIDGSGDAIGPYSFRLWDLAAATSLTLGTVVNGDLSPASETDLYRFNATAGDRFFFDLQANVGASSARWRLFDPYGKSVFERGFDDVDTQTLANTGSYTLVIEGSLNSTGNPTYAFNVQPVPVAAPQSLTLNQTASGAISVRGEEDNFVFRAYPKT